MSRTQLANRILVLLDRRPEYARLLERVVEGEEREIERCRQLPEDATEWTWTSLREDGLSTHFGVERRELGVAQRLLDELVYEEVLELVYATRSHAPYRLVDREETKRALAAGSAQSRRAEDEGEIPANLFEAIAGHDRIKTFFKLSLAAPRPVHGLLVGPPATAKSLFMEVLTRLPRQRYVDGGIATKAGIVEYLLAEEPRFLLIDQIDHLRPEDQQALHGVMATGRVSRLKHGMKEDERRLVWVYATANSARRLSETLLDRFQVLGVPPYTPAEFRAAVRTALVKWERTDPEIADYIGGVMAEREHPSIREAVRVALVARSVQEVDEALRVFHTE